MSGSAPPIRKDLPGLLRDLISRITLVERRLTKAGTAPSVSSGAAAPTAPPKRIGDMFVRTDTKKVYVATGTAAAADWTLMN